MRHPFPGPGLSINVLCSNGILEDATKEELSKAQEEVKALKQTLQEDFFAKEIDASFDTYVLPVKSVGVQGDFRTYRFPAVLDFSSKKDAKTGYSLLPASWNVLEEASSYITNNAKFLNRCVIKLWQNPHTDSHSLRLQEGYCTKYRLDQTREADDIVLKMLHSSGLYDIIFQHLTINLPYASDQNRCSYVLRPLCSEDVMTARFAQLPPDLLLDITQKIASLPYTDAIFFDLSNKPPATFGWE